MHKCVQHYWHRSSTDESCDFVNIKHRHEMNEFSSKTNTNTGVDRLISWFSCWCSPRLGVVCSYDQYWSSPDKRKLSGHKASIYFSSSSNIRCHEWQGGTDACPGNLSTYPNSFALPHKMRHKTVLTTKDSEFNICGSVHHGLYWWNKSNKMQQLRFLFAMALLYMFRLTISPIIRSTMLYMACKQVSPVGRRWI